MGLEEAWWPTVEGCGARDSTSMSLDTIEFIYMYILQKNKEEQGVTLEVVN